MSDYIKLKKKYIKHKSDGSHYIISNNSKSYDRASVLIIEESYNNDKDRNEPAILLFYETRWMTYTEPGGRIDIKDDNFDQVLLETAKREIREETLNTIFVDQKLLEDSQYIDYYNKKTKMYNRVFLIAIKKDEFKKNIYDSNRDIISKQNVPSIWKETSNVNRFYLSDLIECVKDINYYDQYNIPCHDVNNKPVSIYYRTIGIIDMFMKENILKDLISNPRKTKIYGFTVNINEEKFLQGTNTIEIY